MGQRYEAHREDAPHTLAFHPRLEYDHATAPPPGLLTHGASGLPYRVEDASDITHAVEGSRLVPTETTTFFLWTRCGQQDVAACDVYAGRGKPTCPQCATIEASSSAAIAIDARARMLRADLALARALQRIERLALSGKDTRQAYEDAGDRRGIVRQMEREVARQGLI